MSLFPTKTLSVLSFKTSLSVSSLKVYGWKDQYRTWLFNGWSFAGTGLSADRPLTWWPAPRSIWVWFSSPPFPHGFYLRRTTYWQVSITRCLCFWFCWDDGACFKLLVAWFFFSMFFFIFLRGGGVINIPVSNSTRAIKMLLILSHDIQNCVKLPLFDNNICNMIWDLQRKLCAALRHIVNVVFIIAR